MLFFFQKHAMTHDYYHLILVPPVAFFLGTGYARCLTAMWRNRRFEYLFTTIAIFLIPLYFYPTIASHLQVDGKFKGVLEAATFFQQETSFNDFIIGSAGSGSSLLYYSDRRGWSFVLNREQLKEGNFFWNLSDDEKDSVQTLEDLHQEGGGYFAVANKSDLYKQVSLYDYVRTRYKKVYEGDHAIVFDLEKPL